MRGILPRRLEDSVPEPVNTLLHDLGAALNVMMLAPQKPHPGWAVVAT